MEAEKEADVRCRVLQSTLDEAASRTTLTEQTDGSSQDDGHNPCVICLERISERAVAQPCQHQSFDFLCIVSWLQERPACPLCNAVVSSVRYQYSSPEHYKTYLIRSTPATDAGNIDTRGTRLARSDSRRLFHAQRRRTARPSQARLLQSPETAIERRRQVYREQLYSLHVGSNRLSRFRNLTPELFRNDDELVSRARKWIRRELRVFEFLHEDGPVGTDEKASTSRANNAEFLLEYIVAILKTVDIKGSSGQAEEMLQEFIGRQNTQLFLHELRAWLRSPFTSLDDWDRAVQYQSEQLRRRGESFPSETSSANAATRASRPTWVGKAPVAQRPGYRHRLSPYGDHYRPRYEDGSRR